MVRTRSGTLVAGCLMAVLALRQAQGADPYEAPFQRAKELQTQGKLLEAARSYEEALTKKGAPPTIHLTLAKLWVAVKQPERALRATKAYRSAAQPPKEEWVAPIEQAARSLMVKPPKPKGEGLAGGRPEKKGEKLEAKAEGAVAPTEASPPAKDRLSELVRIEPGEFLMGSPPQEPGRDEDELQHKVTIGRPFLLGRTEVTQGQYQAVVGQNPSQNKASDQHPVETVSWFDAVRYCNARSLKEGLPACYQINGDAVSWPEGLACRGYRLPTEAEWEYAARAGQATRYAGSDDHNLVAWYDNQAHAVGGKRPNRWGLLDMSGNVWEWVWDWSASYANEAVVDPLGPPSGSARVYRGGSSWSDARFQRVAYRDAYAPSYRGAGLGFRVVRSLP